MDLVAALSLLAIAVAGFPAALLLDLRGPLLPAGCWLLGAGLLACQMMVLSAVGIPYSRLTLGSCWLIALVAPWAIASLLPGDLPRPRVPAYFRARPRLTAPLVPAALSAILVCAFQVAFTLLQAVRVPLGSFDAWSLWEYRGRHFWLDAGINGAFLHDHAAIFAHPAYPPLLPLLIAWVYTWIGAADPALMKPLFPAFYATLLAAFGAALLCRRGARVALPATAALALVPQVAGYAGTGLADVPLAAALTACAAALAQWQRQGRWRVLIVAGLFLGIALLIKRDGLFFLLAGLPAVWLATRSLRAVLGLALPAVVVAGPWYGYVALTGVPDRDFLPFSPRTFLDHADRLGEIARLFSLNLLAANEWSVLWYAFATVLVMALVGRRLRAGALLLPVLLPLVLYVCSLSLSAWPDYTLHVRTSLDRLILVTVPFALWFIVEQIVPQPEYVAVEQVSGERPLAPF
jgi:hypothetical protein